jgi:PAS domain S-box-containing protein
MTDVSTSTSSGRRRLAAPSGLRRHRCATRWRAWVCLAALQIVTLHAPGWVAANPESVTLQLKWRHQFQFAGSYAAQVKGYYAAEGLEVTIREGTPTQPPLKTVLAGGAQYGVTGSDALEARLRGEPVVLLAVIFQHSPYALLTLRDRRLAHPAALSGRTIMLADDQGGTEIKAMLLAEGLSDRDVHIVPHTWNNEDLIDGQADAMSAYVSVEPFQIRSRGVEVSIIRPVDYGIDFYGDSLFTTSSEMAEHPERAIAMRRASLRGWEYALEHVDEMISLILAMPGVEERGVSAEGLRFEADAMKELILANLIELGHSNRGRWQRMADTYVALGLAHPGSSLDGFAFEPNPPFDRRALKLALGAIALLAGLGGLILLWNYQLRRVVRQRTADLVRSEQQQRHQYDVLQSVLTHMGDGVIVANAAGELSLINPAAEQLHGRALLDGDGDAWPEMFGLYQADGVTLFRKEDLPLSRARRGEACDSVEIRILNPRRGPVIVHVTGRPIRGADGEIQGGVVVMRDVTERERAAAAIRSMNTVLEERVHERTAQLELANRELEAFTYSISHDLRAPLRQLNGFAQALLDEYAPGLSDQGRSHLESIGSAARQMNQLIDSLLNLSRVTSAEVHWGPVDLSALAHGIADELGQSQPTRSVHFEIAPGILTRGDAVLLRQLMHNLLENAWKYTSKHPTARIEFGMQMRERPDAPAGEVSPVYFVRDDGAGFDAAYAHDLFRPFRRLHRAADFEGIGVGLAIAERIVQRHSGEIWADSAPERGATFYFTLNG